MPLRCSQDYTAQAPWLPGASSQLIGRGRSSVYWLVSLVCSLLSSHPLSSNCTTQHAGQNLGWLRYCERIHRMNTCCMCFSCKHYSTVQLTTQWCCQSKYRWVSGPLSPSLCQRFLLPAAASRTLHTDEVLQRWKKKKTPHTETHQQLSFHCINKN